MSAMDIVQGSEVNTPANAAHVDAGPLRSAYLSQGASMAQGAEAVGQFFSEVGQKFQENQNARTLLDADLKMRQFSDQYRDSLKTNPNEGSWAPTFKDQSDELKASLLEGGNVGPAVRRQMQANLDRWQQAQHNEITTAAQIQALNRTKDTVEQNYTYALHQGDIQGAMNAIKMGEESHALFPEVAERMRRDAPGVVQRSQADLLIETNPKQAYDELKATGDDGKPSGAFKNLDPNSRLRLTTQAAWRWHAAQTQAADGIRADVDSGNIPTDDQIKQQEDAGDISPRGAASLRRYIRQKDWADSRAEAAEVLSDASSYDPTHDKEGKEYRDISDSAVGLPQKYRDRVMRTLKERVKDSDKSDDGMKTIDRLYEARVFGDWTKPVDPRDPASPRRRDNELWSKVNSARWDMQEALSQWRQQNPQANHGDERKFIMQRAQRYTDHRAMQAITDSLLPGNTK
jgi:hypothetical protein